MSNEETQPIEISADLYSRLRQMLKPEFVLYLDGAQPQNITPSDRATLDAIVSDFGNVFLNDRVVNRLFQNPESPQTERFVRLFRESQVAAQTGEAPPSFETPIETGEGRTVDTPLLRQRANEIPPDISGTSMTTSAVTGASREMLPEQIALAQQMQGEASLPVSQQSWTYKSPRRPRSVRVLANKVEPNQMRQLLADDLGGVQYDTLSELQTTYYGMASPWEFWNYINEQEIAARTQLQNSEGILVSNLMDRYDMIQNIEGLDFNFKDKYSWLELTALPVDFSPEQTAFLNAKWETLGLYERYGVRVPQYVTDNLDFGFGVVWKNLIAESIGRDITLQQLMDTFAEEQIGEIERALAEFDDQTIAEAFDALSLRERGVPLTADEFTALKNLLPMFDENITEEELRNDLAGQLETLSQPAAVATSQPAYSSFMREAEQKFATLFKDDARVGLMRTRRQTQNPISASDYLSRRTYEAGTPTPEIIQQQGDM